MAFVELKPPQRQVTGDGTGVRVSLTERCGLRVSLSTAAREVLGMAGDAPADARFKVLVDRDPALPRLRIVRSDFDGLFKLGSPPKSAKWRFITIGHEHGFARQELTGLDCAWEPGDDLYTIDIDLPREFRGSKAHQPVGQPSVSSGPRPRPVSVAGR